jgi:hypothetical protein
MKATMSGAIGTDEALNAVAWVMSHLDCSGRTAGQQPPSSARAAASNNVSLGGAAGESVKKRAPNVFQGAGRLKCTDWVAAVRTCQDECEECVPWTTLPRGFPKARPKRTKGMEKPEWRAGVDEFTLALMETFGHRELTQTKNPDHNIRTSVWTCGECSLVMRTNLDADNAWQDLQVQGITQLQVDETPFNFICALTPAPTYRTPACEPPTCEPPMCLTPMCLTPMCLTPMCQRLSCVNPSRRFGVDGRTNLGR